MTKIRLSIFLLQKVVLFKVSQLHSKIFLWKSIVQVEVKHLFRITKHIQEQPRPHLCSKLARDQGGRARRHRERLRARRAGERLRVHRNRLRHCGGNRSRGSLYHRIRLPHRRRCAIVRGLEGRGRRNADLAELLDGTCLACNSSACRAPVPSMPDLLAVFDAEGQEAEGSDKRKDAAEHETHGA